MMADRATEIREALTQFRLRGATAATAAANAGIGTDLVRIERAARAYADLLEKGEWMHSHDNLTGEDREVFQWRLRKVMSRNRELYEKLTPDTTVDDAEEG